LNSVTTQTILSIQSIFAMA